MKLVGFFWCCFLFFFFNTHLSICLLTWERDRQIDIDVREKHGSVTPACALTRDRTCNPCMCPDWGSKPQTFWYMGRCSNWATQPELLFFNLISVCSFLKWESWSLSRARKTLHVIVNTVMSIIRIWKYILLQSSSAPSSSLSPFLCRKGKRYNTPHPILLTYCVFSNTLFYILQVV